MEKPIAKVNDIENVPAAVAVKISAHLNITLVPNTVAV